MTANLLRNDFSATPGVLCTWLGKDHHSKLQNISIHQGNSKSHESILNPRAGHWAFAAAPPRLYLHRTNLRTNHMVLCPTALTFLQSHPSVATPSHCHTCHSCFCTPQDKSLVLLPAFSYLDTKCVHFICRSFCRHVLILMSLLRKGILDSYDDKKSPSAFQSSYTPLPSPWATYKICSHNLTSI